MGQQLLLLLAQPVEQEEANRNSILSTIAILVGIAVGLAALAGSLRRWAKGEIQTLATESAQTRGQLKTSNGRTVASFMEGSYQNTEKICEKLDRYHQTSVQALTLAQSNRESLDRHLEGHPSRRSGDARS